MILVSSAGIKSFPFPPPTFLQFQVNFNRFNFVLNGNEQNRFIDLDAVDGKNLRMLMIDK
jgi:hypothetical protein